MNAQQVTLRSVRQTDMPYVFALFASVRGPELDLTGMDASQKHQFLQTQFNAMHSHYAERFPSATHDIVLTNGKPSGRIYINETNDEIRLLDIIVDPAQRNKGIGSQLLNRIIDKAQKTGKTVRFYVWHSNEAAQRFYKRHGFGIVPSPEAPSDAYILMERQFS